MNEERDNESEELTLEELLAEVTPENYHEEVESSGPVGSEIW
jgi:antitoxin component of MazEF toxin-antitoxin module